MARLRARRMRRADIPCGYCFEEWAVCYDHINPVCNGGSNRLENLYPACRRCNALVSGKSFASLEEKRAYVQEELKKRGEWSSADDMRKLRKKVS
jgi:5-methylcytosine-specific restriction endonuclease McrA